MSAKAIPMDPLAGANGAEREYGERLAILVHAREVKSWIFHPMRLRLADGTYYSPDFLVVDAADVLELHEVKGHMREAARVRLNVAARLFPFRFVLVWATETRGGWSFKPEVVTQ